MRNIIINIVHIPFVHNWFYPYMILYTLVSPYVWGSISLSTFSYKSPSGIQSLDFLLHRHLLQTPPLAWPGFEIYICIFRCRNSHCNNMTTMRLLFTNGLFPARWHFYIEMSPHALFTNYFADFPYFFNLGYIQNFSMMGTYTDLI